MPAASAASACHFRRCGHFVHGNSTDSLSISCSFVIQIQSVALTFNSLVRIGAYFWHICLLGYIAQEKGIGSGLT